MEYQSLASMLERRLSLRHLRVVDAIERERSLARAAGSLQLTQSAVTKALQEVELLTGTPVFQRSNRGAIATAYGQLLVRHARVLLSQLKRAVSDLDAWSQGCSPVRIGTLPSASAGLLPQAVARALAVQPALRVSLMEGQQAWLTTLLRRGELDFVAGRLPPNGGNEDARMEKLGMDCARLVVRRGHPLASERRRSSLATLRQWSWILPPPDMALRQQIDAEFHHADLEPPAACVESSSFLSNRNILLATDFITVWPQYMAEAEMSAGHVIALDVELPLSKQAIGAWWLKESALSPAAELILMHLRELYSSSTRR